MAYYRSPVGWRKKKRLNARRGRQQGVRGTPQQQPRQQGVHGTPQQQPREQAAVPERQRSSEEFQLQVEGVVLRESSLRTSPLLPYVRMVVSLIEGVRLEAERIVELLRRAMRQHSMAITSRVDYVLRFLHQHPP